MRLFKDILTVLTFFTRLPISYDRGAKHPSLADATWAFPLVGIFIGGVAVLCAKIVLAFGLSTMFAALFVVFVQIIITGGLHEDGLADCADGFWGAHNSEKRLEIMKDSRIGTYGVLALGIFFLARFLLVSELIYAQMTLLLIGISAVSRVPLAFGLRLKNARPEGLAAQMGKPSLIGGGMAAIVSAIVLFMCLWSQADRLGSGFGSVFWVLGAFIALGLCSVWVFWLAYRKIGGQTGDTLGALQQCGEVMLLTFFSAIVS